VGVQSTSWNFRLPWDYSRGGPPEEANEGNAGNAGNDGNEPRKEANEGNEGNSLYIF